MALSLVAFILTVTTQITIAAINGGTLIANTQKDFETKMYFEGDFAQVIGQAKKNAFLAQCDSMLKNKSNGYIMCTDVGDLQGSIFVAIKGLKEDIINGRKQSGFWVDVRQNGLDLPSFKHLELEKFDTSHCPYNGDTESGLTTCWGNSAFQTCFKDVTPKSLRNDKKTAAYKAVMRGKTVKEQFGLYETCGIMAATHPTPTRVTHFTSIRGSTPTKPSPSTPSEKTSLVATHPTPTRATHFTSTRGSTSTKPSPSSPSEKTSLVAGTIAAGIIGTILSVVAIVIVIICKKNTAKRKGPINIPVYNFSSQISKEHQAISVSGEHATETHAIDEMIQPV